MRTTSEPTLGLKRLKAFTRLLMRLLLRAMRTKCTRLIWFIDKTLVILEKASNLNVNIAVCDRVSLPRDDADGKPEDYPMEFHQDLGTSFGEVFDNITFYQVLDRWFKLGVLRWPQRTICLVNSQCECTHSRLLLCTTG